MKRAKLTEDLSNTTVPNYSDLLLQSFHLKASKFTVHFYKLKNLARFGVLLPASMKPSPTHLVEGYRVLKLKADRLEDLKAFQATLWGDLFKVTQVERGSSDTCNYLVVPVKADQIDFSLVNRALGNPLDAVEPIVGKYVQSKHSQRILWEVLQVVDKTTPAEDFLKGLLGRQNPDLTTYSNKCAGKSAFDILFDDSWKIPALAGFRNQLAKKKESVSDHNKVLLVKQVHSVRSNKKSKPVDNYPQGTPVLHMNSVTLSYLDSELVEQSFSLPQTLIDLESFSFICDFCKAFEFDCSDYKHVYAALRTPSLDAKDNYESLETLGDTVLKFLTSFHHFLIYKDCDESFLTRRRTYVINNSFLGKTGVERGIHYFVKTKALKVSRWKPPYFDSPELVFTKTIVHRLTSGMVADTVEALIGAFYVSKGLLHAVEFIDRIGLIKRGADWDAVKSYCDYNPFAMLTATKLKDLIRAPRLPLKDLIARPKHVPKAGSEQGKWRPMLKSLNYEEGDFNIFQAAFTHPSFNPYLNYERLEFLGDALLDLVVLTNCFTSSDEPTPPHTLTLMHHALVNNNVLAFFSISLNLHSYIRAEPEVESCIDAYLADLKWDDDLLNFGVHSQDPPKILADLFEAFAAALLMDSHSVSLACRVMQIVMVMPIAYLSLNRDQCQSNIVTRAKEFVQKRGQRLIFRSEHSEGAHTVRAMVGDKELGRHTACSRWLAEKFAANKAYHLLISSTSNPSH